jgi:hypothetical protein
MATLLVPRTTSSQDLARQLDMLEQDGGEVVQVVPTGDHYLIVYKFKAKQARQPAGKVETR